MNPPTLSIRTAGILLHPTSLPGPLGSGDLGPTAYQFADALHQAGLRWWQMLPITPPGPAPGYSPYTSYSAFAGSNWLVSPQKLLERGLLSQRDIARASAAQNGVVDFAKDRRVRMGLLRKAFAAAGTLTRSQRDEFDHFVHKNASWLNDYVLYAAIKEAQKDAPWQRWPTDLRLRRPDAIAAARKSLATAIGFQQFIQWMFDLQWMELKRYCNHLGIGLIGDIPIFVSHDSAAVWGNPKLFLLDRHCQPTVVSGYPPDCFSPKGQLWGHPHYNWPAHIASGFAWWLSRFERTLDCFDAARIDHFLGFHRVWAVPAKAKDAVGGKWKVVPGDQLFAALRKRVGEAPIIAEDLGTPTPQALALRDKFKFPGMRIMQFAFGDGEYHRPDAFPRHCIAYTGTHDNQTIVGWYDHLKATGNGEFTRAASYVGANGRKPHWDFIRALFTSVARTVIIPAQDALGLGAEHRMNVPGVATGNWGWRMNGPMPAHVVKRLHDLCEATGRLAPEIESQSSHARKSHA
jgi:4-alpha-glucanotransferase